MRDLVLLKSLFQFQAIFEGFAHPFCYLVITVSVRVKSNGIYQRHINFTVHHHTLIRCDIDNLSDHAAAIFVALVFNEFALQTDGKFVDNWCIYGFGFAGSQTAAFKLVRHPVPGFNTEVVRFNHVCSICNTHSESTTGFDIL